MAKKKYLYIILSALILLISLLFSSYYISQTQVTGSITINHPNLTSKISIYTDKHGFTHISAVNRKDAFFALGFAQGRDRLFQLDYNRRLSEGRLSEIFGEDSLKDDIISRQFGLQQAAKKDYETMKKNPEEHGEILEILQLFVDGVNFFAENYYLPIEYHILGIKFEKYTVADVLAYLRYFDFLMTDDAESEVKHQILHDVFGKKYFDLFYNVSLFDYPYYNETTISKEFLKEHNLTGKNDKPENMKDYIYNLNPPIIDHTVIDFTKLTANIPKKVYSHEASNSWVVHGNFSKNRKPIISNDPHLTNQMPNYHYISKLYINNNEEIVVGSFMTGTPFMIIGNNKKFGFVITIDPRERTDIIEEHIDDPDISKAKYYFVDGKKYDLQTEEQIFKIKGKEDYKHIFKKTKHGYLIDEIPSSTTPIGFDFKYVSSKPEKSNAFGYYLSSNSKLFDLRFLYHRMFAKDKKDIFKYIDSYVGPTFNFAWGTTNNEIGYIPIGYLQVKENEQQTFKPGYDTKLYDITKFKDIKFEERPMMVNPEKGFVVTANSHAIDDSYKYYKNGFEVPWRHHRINELLKEKTKNKNYTVADSLEILKDTKDSLCELFLPKILKNLNNKIDKKHKAYKLYEMLSEFDCKFTKQSKAAVVYEVYIKALAEFLSLKNAKNNVDGFEDLGIVRAFIGNRGYYYLLYKLLSSELSNSHDEVFNNCRYFNIKHNCRDFFNEVFLRVPELLKEFNYVKGDEPKKWGNVLKQYFPHYISYNSLLDKIFSRVAFSAGNRNTVKFAKSAFTVNENDPFNSMDSANFKYVNDLTDPTRPYMCLDSGNSGNIFSKFYDNLMVRCEKDDLVKIEDHEFSHRDKEEFVIRVNEK